MAYADYSDYKNSIAQSTQRVQSGFRSYTPGIGSLVGKAWDMFPSAYPDADAPTTAVVPSSALLGWTEIANGGAGRLVVNSIDIQGWAKGLYILCDRLSHQGGLVGNVTTTQTTNLPTAALTRYTSGEGVMAMVTTWIQIGASASTYTISYTNQAGTSAQTSVPATIGGDANNRAVNRAFFTPLAAGDSGVRSVESFTLASSTGVAGSLSIALIKPLLYVNVVDQNSTYTADFLSNNMHGGMPEILDDAFLFWVCVAGQTTMKAVGNLNLTEV